MKKYIFFLVGLCCALLPAMADQPEQLELKASDANIIGHVLDKKTGEHLSYITIALKGTTIGTVTDATGHYFLKNLPEGNFVLEASSVGYKTISRNVSLRKGKTLEENFELEEDAVALDGVVVSANRSVTKRRLAPTLVNVVDMKMFENTNSPTLSQGLPARRPGRNELSELRFPAGAHQRTGRSVYTDSYRFASHLQCPFRCLRVGADSCQYDRARRGDARRRFCPVRFVRHCRNH